MMTLIKRHLIARTVIADTVAGAERRLLENMGHNVAAADSLKYTAAETLEGRSEEGGGGDPFAGDALQNAASARPRPGRARAENAANTCLREDNGTIAAEFFPTTIALCRLLHEHAGIP